MCIVRVREFKSCQVHAEYSLITRILAIYANTRYLHEYTLYTRYLHEYSLFTRYLHEYSLNTRYLREYSLSTRWAHASGIFEQAWEKCFDPASTASPELPGPASYISELNPGLSKPSGSNILE